MESYEAWKLMHAPSIAFLAKEFPSAKPPASLLLDTLTPIVPRYYSISSSPKKYRTEVQLTVALLEYKSNGNLNDMFLQTLSYMYFIKAVFFLQMALTTKACAHPSLTLQTLGL